MKKSNIATLLIFLVAIPATLFQGSRMSGKWYYLTSTLIIIELLIPFFMTFEGRKPQARELILLAVLCAMGVASRAAFYMLPNFKPVTALVIVTADHGGHDRTHGTPLPEDMTIPVVFCGPKFEKGKTLSGVSIKDIAPTVTALLGVEPDEDWEGKSLI